MSTSLLIGTLLIIDSMHYIFARMLIPHLPPSVSALFVLLISTIEVVATKRLKFESCRKNVWFFLGIGLLVAASTNLSYAAVCHTHRNDKKVRRRYGFCQFLFLQVVDNLSFPFPDHIDHRHDHKAIDDCLGVPPACRHNGCHLQPVNLLSGVTAIRFKHPYPHSYAQSCCGNPLDNRFFRNLPVHPAAHWWGHCNLRRICCWPFSGI